MNGNLPHRVDGIPGSFLNPLQLESVWNIHLISFLGDVNQRSFRKILTLEQIQGHRAGICPAV